MPKTPDYFAGKTIVITGAASGIGRATANIFAREGANVVCADINEAGAKETAAQVNAKGSQALALKVDVTKRAQVDDMVKRAVDAFGSVQFLFNSAGRRDPPRQVSRDRRRADREDLRPQCQGHALRHAGRAAAHAANKFGVIVNVGSMAHRRGGPGSSVHYAAAKGAVVTMTMGVAREFADARHPRAVDLAGPGEDAVPGRRRDDAGACRSSSTTCRWSGSASPRRSASWCCSCARMPARS